MMKKILSTFLVINIMVIFFRPLSVQAQNGLPNSANFGYGVRLDLLGSEINASINTAGSLKLDWLAVDFDWAYIWPTEDAVPQLDTLTQAMYLAQQNSLNVMVSITLPPDWVIKGNGPDPVMTTKVAEYLVRTFPGVVKAIELFPGANTNLGWGTTPDPGAYMKLLKTVTKAVRALDKDVTVVAAGLVPLSPNPAPGDIDDLAFLDALYNAGGSKWMPIIGLRMLETTGDPMYVPQSSEKRAFRHFEEVRKTMLDHGDRDGLLWVTGFSWPSGDIQNSDNTYKRTEEQTRWLTQAYQLLKAQLYIGVAFFTQINPQSTKSSLPVEPSLIRSDLTFHPALANLGLLIIPPADNSKIAVQIVLTKRIVQEMQFKPTQQHASYQP